MKNAEVKWIIIIGISLTFILSSMIYFFNAPRDTEIEEETKPIEMITTQTDIQQHIPPSTSETTIIDIPEESTQVSITMTSFDEAKYLVTGYVHLQYDRQENQYYAIPNSNAMLNLLYNYQHGIKTEGYNAETEWKKFISLLQHISQILFQESPTTVLHLVSPIDKNIILMSLENGKVTKDVVKTTEIVYPSSTQNNADPDQVNTPDGYYGLNVHRQLYEGVLTETPQESSQSE